MIAQTIKILVFLLVIPFAKADVLYLNALGQAELETTPVPKEGIVRKIDMQERIIYWQPYRKGWKWDDDDYVEIEIKWVQQLKPEIDTLEDIKTHRRLLDKYVQTGMIVPKYEDMWSGPYSLVTRVLETFAKIELNRMEEADVGLYQELQKFLDEMITEYAKVFTPDFVMPTTPEGRKKALANNLINNIFIGYVINYKQLDEIHFSKKPYSTSNYFVDPRLVALQCYKYVPRVWKEFKGLNNHDMAFQLLQNSYLNTSKVNIEAKYKNREQMVRDQSPALLSAYYKSFPDHIERNLKDQLLVDYIQWPSPFYSKEKHDLMTDIFIQVASAKDSASLVYDLVYYNIDADLYDGYQPNQIFVNLLKRVIATRAGALQELKKIIVDKKDRARGSEPGDPRLTEIQFLESLIITP
jgi:hypothetical protein